MRLLVTDLGTFTMGPDGFVLTAVPAGDGPVADRVAAAVTATAWTAAVADEVAELPAPTIEEVRALRRWDPEATFLRS